MANLPVERVTPSRPFLHTGVDYAGPFNLKTWKGRGHRTYKAYVAVFVCLSTRAVHLEIVTSMLSTDFLAALTRFTSRRGLCSDLYSDRGTTFIGANSELRELFKEAWYNEIAEGVATRGIRWHFIPPYSPHFGGLWEAAVKSFKHHFRRVTRERVLTYEEMTTLTAAIESCLNSRPLGILSTDPTDPAPLTPGHFLIGDSLLALPEPNLLDKNSNHLMRWRLLLQIKQHFWQRWAREYLHTLQQRYKWDSEYPNCQIGDIVLVLDNTPPNKWILGKVEAVHPGKDGMVRTVTLRCRGSLFKRNITKLCRLPILTSCEDNGLGDPPREAAC